jgi:intracellular sulfur oxidation DsrE/DsrF family protein
MFGKTPLNIDIPVKLDNLKVAFSVDRIVFEDGKDLLVPAFHLGLVARDLADSKGKGTVIAIFHTNGGHVTLNDEAYNLDRGVQTGNPYKTFIAELTKRGMQFELCGATAKSHGWGNADVLPGIKINTDAMARLIQLGQEGFLLMKE